MKSNGETKYKVKVSPSYEGEIEAVRVKPVKGYSQEAVTCPDFSVAAKNKPSTMAAYQFKDPKYTGTPHNPFQVQKDKGKPNKDTE